MLNKEAGRFGGIIRGLINRESMTPFAAGAAGAATAPIIQNQVGIESDWGRMAHTAGNALAWSMLGRKGARQAVTPINHKKLWQMHADLQAQHAKTPFSDYAAQAQFLNQNAPRTFSPYKAMTGLAIGGLPTTVGKVTDGSRYWMEHTIEKIKNNPNYMDPHEIAKAVGDYTLDRGSSKLKAQLGASPETPMIDVIKNEADKRVRDLLNLDPQIKDTSEAIRAKGIGKALDAWNNQDKEDTTSNDIKNWVKGQFQALKQNAGVEAGGITGSVAGGSLGGLAGNYLADMLFPSLPTADFKRLNEAQFRKRYQEERKRERFRSTAKIVGSLLGTTAGAVGGMKLAPHLMGKQSSVSELAKQAAYKQASEDTDRLTRLYHNFIARPAIGAGLGLAASGITNNFAEELGLRELSPEERKQDRRRAMFGGAIIGLGKGALNEASTAGLLPFKA